MHPVSGRVLPASEVIEAQHKAETRPVGWHAFPEAQLRAAAAAARALHDRYGFIDILGYDDIAPGRKVDPGPAFPMASRIGAKIPAGVVRNGTDAGLIRRRADACLVCGRNPS